MTDSQIIRAYREIKKNDSRCGQCKCFLTSALGRDWGFCSLEHSQIWPDDHACCDFSSPDES